MTRRTSARVAGAAFLLYIAVGITVLILDGVTAGADIPARLTRFAEHETRVRMGIVLSLLTSAMAITLAITLQALTRDVDPELAAIGSGFRLAEGILVAGGQLLTLGLLWLAAHAAGGVETEAALLLHLSSWNVVLASMMFAAGSTLFAWLFVRGRLLPMWLAWLGLGASVLLVLALGLQLAGVRNGTISNAIWAAMALFEVTLAFWLIFRGASAPFAPATSDPASARVTRKPTWTSSSI